MGTRDGNRDEDGGVEGGEHIDDPIDTHYYPYSHELTFKVKLNSFNS